MQIELAARLGRLSLTFFGSERLFVIGLRCPSVFDTSKACLLVFPESFSIASIGWGFERLHSANASVDFSRLSPHEPAKQTTPGVGYVCQILIASSPSSGMESKSRVRAVPGKGLEGDRYFQGVGTFSPPTPKPDYELTLIEEENVEAFVAESGLAFTAADARRNVVTLGVRLNDLVGQEFCVGAVRVRGLQLCEPCSYLAKRSCPEVLKGLVHKGGLRAQILSEGDIGVGDKIEGVGDIRPNG